VFRRELGILPVVQTSLANPPHGVLGRAVGRMKREVSLCPVWVIQGGKETVCAGFRAELLQQKHTTGARVIWERFKSSTRVS
jgi:hypothetical protein